MRKPKYLDVFLPKMLPSPVLSPNRGARRDGRVPEMISKAKREMRADVAIGMLAFEQVREWDSPADYAHVVLTLRTMSAQQASATNRRDGTAGKRYRPDDSGNAVYALKAAIDGMIDAGILVDDSYRHMFHSCIVERVETVEDEGLRIQVYELPDRASDGDAG